MIRYATNKDIPEIVRIINSAFRVEDFFVNGDTVPFPDKAKLSRDAHMVRMTKRLTV